jgi:hypothetical protein
MRLMQRCCFFLGVACFGGSLAAQSAATPPESRCMLDPPDACKLYTVSMVELIANSTLWNGKPVSVHGYLHLEFESNALYLHEDDYKHALTPNSVSIDFSRVLKPGDVTCKSDTYVTVVGTYGARGAGLPGMHSGHISVERCAPWY